MLTDDDKRWLTERFDSLGVELNTVRAEFSERIDRVRVELAERLDSVRVEFSERLEKVETTLLTEFHKWASPVETRQRSHAAALRAMDEEVESLADWLKKLEGR
jgi:DNA anti-recombination protein RmuC